MLAQAMVPVLQAKADNEDIKDDEDNGEAINRAQTAVNRFPTLYAESYSQHMLPKIGLFEKTTGTDMTLLEQLLALMQTHQVDFTLCFRALSDATSDRFLTLFAKTEAAQAWYATWQDRLGGAHDVERMQHTNPGVIPRNHWIEATIQAAVQNDWSLFERFEKALQTPFQEHKDFSTPPQPEERVQATFCGT